MILELIYVYEIRQSKNYTHLNGRFLSVTFKPKKKYVKQGLFHFANYII